jgi:hypothetical protein
VSLFEKQKVLAFPNSTLIHYESGVLNNLENEYLLAKLNFDATGNLSSFKQAFQPPCYMDKCNLCYAKLSEMTAEKCNILSRNRNNFVVKLEKQKILFLGWVCV